MKKKPPLPHFFAHLTKFEILVALYIFLLLLSELMGAKLIPLGQIGDWELSSSVAIFALPFICSINDIIIEVYGPKRARALARLGLLVIVLIALAALLFTSLPPSPKFAGQSNAYNAIFGFSIRVSLASITAFAISQFTDILIFRKIRQRLGKRSLWLRNNLSNVVALLIDTVIFMLIARYDFSQDFAGNLPYLLGLILPYWLLKCSMSFLITPLTYRGVKWLRTPYKNGVNNEKSI